MYNARPDPFLLDPFLLARATATWYSIVETAKANGLEPYWYLRKIFEEMPVYLRDGKPVDDLLPWNVDTEELNRLAERD